MDKHSRVKAILFDFDGTLVTLEVDWDRVRKQLLHMDSIQLSVR